jgi:hypothetical protein
VPLNRIIGRGWHQENLNRQSAWPSLDSDSSAEIFDGNKRTLRAAWGYSRVRGNQIEETDMGGLFSMTPGAVDLSAAAEAGIGEAMAATTAAGAAALTGVMPMALDDDSVRFAIALNAAGAAYLATASEHVGQRTALAGAQDLASATGVATEVLRAAANALP